MMKLSTYIIDVKEAQEKLLDVLGEMYEDGDLVTSENLQDNINEFLDDDVIYNDEADKMLYDYGINAAVEEFGNVYPIETIDLSLFNCTIVNTLQILEVSELAEYALTSESMPVSKVIEAVKNLDLSEFDY